MLLSGEIKMYLFSGGFGVCVDLVVYLGYFIFLYYDSMIVKVIIYGKMRDEVIVCMKCVLSEFVIEGIEIIILFYLKLFEYEIFVGGEFNMKFLEIYDVMGL